MRVSDVNRTFKKILTELSIVLRQLLGKDLQKKKLMVSTVNKLKK